MSPTKAILSLHKNKPQDDCFLLWVGDNTEKEIDMKKLIIILLLLCCQQAEAEWWTDDKVANGLMVSANTLLIVDWAQTRSAADSNDFIETGWAGRFIGETPSTGEVNRYFLSSIIVYNTVNYLLPARYKKVLSSGIIALQISVVRDNYRVGVGMKF